MDGEEEMNIGPIPPQDLQEIKDQHTDPDFPPSPALARIISMLERSENPIEQLLGETLRSADLDGQINKTIHDDVKWIKKWITEHEEERRRVLLGHLDLQRMDIPDKLATLNSGYVWLTTGVALCLGGMAALTMALMYLWSRVGWVK